MTTRIINNVQITVKNIHIRYEDSISAPGVSWPTNIDGVIGLIGICSIRFRLVLPLRDLPRHQ